MKREKFSCESRIRLREKKLRRYEKQYNLISLFRLLMGFYFLWSFYYMYKVGVNSFIIVSFIIAVGIFMALTKVHEKVYQSKLIEKNSIKLNKDDALRLNGQWRRLKDLGEEFLDINHPYINDLNIFGKDSFFQWINITETIYGRKKLANMLCNSGKTTREKILEEQIALKELSENIELREKIYSALIQDKKRKFNEEDFIKFCEEENYSFIGKPINLIRIFGPILTIIALILTIFGKMDFSYFILLFLINLAVLKIVERDVAKILGLFEDIRFTMGGYLNALELLESSNFKSEKLSKLKGNLLSSGGASKSIKGLYGIASWLYDRKNVFYIVLNGLLYWDFQILYRAEKWKKSEGKKIRFYFENFGEFEALESLSLLAREREDFVMPEIIDIFEMKAKNISHPMINGKAIDNDFSLDCNKRVALITGSNMSGKSTFLRTIGFNSFLAYLGLPVKAKSLSLPIMSIYSCMRTTDNLEENISSFYAEILRVKIVVEAVKEGENVLFLLDEIFKGTNSIDRHDGARVLIEQLLRGESMGLVSTHDLELCSLEEEKKEIVNYNFREYYENNKLNFDYKLRFGISNTRNAKYLMKMAGIDI